MVKSGAFTNVSFNEDSYKVPKMSQYMKIVSLKNHFPPSSFMSGSLKISMNRIGKASKSGMNVWDPNCWSKHHLRRIGTN